MRRSLKWVLLCITFVIGTSSMVTQPAALSTVEIEVDDVTRAFLRYVPQAAEDDPLPMLFLMHGLGSRAQNMANPDLIAFAEEEGVLLVAPQALDPGTGSFGAMWQVADVAFLEAILANLRDAYAVDDSRIYMLGNSGGGVMAHYVGAVMNDTFAAIVSRAGISVDCPAWRDVGGLVAFCQVITDLRLPPPPERALPVMFIHGTADAIVPYEGARRSLDLWVEWNDCATPPEEATEAEGVAVELFAECADDAAIVFITLEGGNHGAGLDDYGVDNLDVVWAFLSQFMLDLTDE